jgi:hypothetical protein
VNPDLIAAWVRLAKPVAVADVGFHALTAAATLLACLLVWAWEVSKSSRW